MNVRFNIIPFVLVVTIFYCTFWQCSTNDKDNVIAKAGNYNITKQDFTERYERFLISTGVKDSPIAREQILNHMVNELLLTKLDKNDHIINSPEFKNVKELIWKELLLAYYKEKEIYGKINITDDELRGAFVKVNQKVSARHLFARTLEEANRLYQQVQSGMTFVQLAPFVFEDKVLSQNGGYLGYFTWGDMDPSFEEVAYSLKIGEISKPVRTTYGYNIIKVEDRIQNPILTESEYNRKKSSIRRLLSINKIKKSEKEYLGSILNNLAIEFEESSIRKLLKFSEFNNRISEKNNLLNNNATLLKYAGGSLLIKEGLNQIQKLALSNRKRINSEKMLKTALKGLVLQQWLIKDAKEKDYHNSEQFNKVYDQWIFGELIRLKKQDLEKSIQIPDTAIEEYYERHKYKFLTEEKINVQEILLTSKNEADRIIQLLRKGEDFAQLAEKNTIRKWAAPNGGILGLSPISRFGYIKKYLKDVPIMKTIGPIQIDDFYIIARIIDRKKSEQLSIDEAKDKIKETVRQENKQLHFVDYIKTLRKKYSIEIDQKQLMEVKIPV